MSPFFQFFSLIDYKIQLLTIAFLLFHSFNRYLAIAARTTRNALKDEKKVLAQRRNINEAKSAIWEKGVRK